jgi:16S rRNA (guanine966-N2)-methyltransferase
MRIISGEFRGRILKAPPGLGTRPMLDRVREAMFSTLGPGIEGARVLDLFAGSGSLGLEALSRGAEGVRFVETETAVVQILKANAEALGASERVEILRGSALARSSWQPPEGQPQRWADLVLFDPPYPWLSNERRGPLLEAVSTLLSEVLAPGGLFVFHTPKRGVQASDFEARFEPDARKYGSSALWYLRAPKEQPASSEDPA